MQPALHHQNRPLFCNPVAAREFTGNPLLGIVPAQTVVYPPATLAWEFLHLSRSIENPTRLRCACREYRAGRQRTSAEMMGDGTASAVHLARGQGPTASDTGWVPAGNEEPTTRSQCPGNRIHSKGRDIV